MTKLTPSQKLLAEKAVCILLLRGESVEGGKIFAYVGVRADKLEEFMRAQQRGNFDPEKYGVILEAGQGDPTPEIMERMKTEYGFDHENMIDIPSAETPTAE